MKLRSKLQTERRFCNIIYWLSHLALGSAWSEIPSSFKELPKKSSKLHEILPKLLHEEDFYLKGSCILNKIGSMNWELVFPSIFFYSFNFRKQILSLFSTIKMIEKVFMWKDKKESCNITRTLLKTLGLKVMTSLDSQLIKAILKQQQQQ